MIIVMPVCVRVINALKLHFYYEGTGFVIKK